MTLLEAAVHSIKLTLAARVDREMLISHGSFLSISSALANISQDPAALHIEGALSPQCRHALPQSISRSRMPDLSLRERYP